jgi:hypothetical protein
MDVRLGVFSHSSDLHGLSLVAECAL